MGKGSNVRRLHIEGQEWRYTFRSGMASGKVRIFFPDGKLAQEVAHHDILGCSFAEWSDAKDQSHIGGIPKEDRVLKLAITPARVTRYIEEHLLMVWR